MYGAISVQIRIAIALRILAGGSYMDAAMVFGAAVSSTYAILWEVIDAINNTPAVGPFFFPQTEEECKRAASQWQAKSLNAVFDGVVAAVDGLFIKAIAPTARDTLNVLAYYSGSKSGYGINVQATCTVNYRFCSMSAIAPGSMNDWAVWCRSCLSTAVSRLPKNFYILGDAAYPIHDKLLTPYPGKRLTPGEDSFNFHLSQLRVRIEQSFGMLVSAWGILWRPLRVKFEGRADLITALFHLHNFIRDEKGMEVGLDEEDIAWNGVRPGLRANGTLPANWANAQPSRTGECAMRASLRCRLEMDEQWRPVYNIERNESD